MRSWLKLVLLMVTSAQAGPVDDTPSLFCIRSTASCWACAPLSFPQEVPCASTSCDGQCVRRGDKETCRAAQQVCCDGGACDRPPLNKPCAAECGDPDGDGHADRCLVPAECKDKAQLDDFFAHYRVTRPAAFFEAVCRPLPKTFPDDHGADEATSCGPENIAWVIHEKTMRNGAGDKTGPGLCYGVVRVGRDGQTVQRCGKYHCQTLLSCSGKETPQYCTVLSTCQNGKVSPTGLTW